MDSSFGPAESTSAISGARIWNPLDHGIHDAPLMVPAHEHNQITGGLLTENRELRVLLATHYSGGNLYTDDGELQDAGQYPHIDFRRDSVPVIIGKMQQRANIPLKRALETISMFKPH